MNWLEISIGIIFLICIITGLIRGAVRIIVSLVATIVTLVIVFFATPYVSQTIEKYTPLDDMIRQKVVSTMADAATSAISGGDSYSDKGGLTEEAVKKVLKAAGVSEEKLESYGISIADIVSGKVSSDDLAKYGISANVLDGLKNSGNESVENAIENADIPESLQETLIKSADIPAAFKNLLLKNNNKATYQKLGVTTFCTICRCVHCKTGDQYYCIHFNIYSGHDYFESSCVCTGYCNRTSGSRSVESSGGRTVRNGDCVSYCLDYIYGDHINVYNRYRKRNLQNGRR